MRSPVAGGGLGGRETETMRQIVMKPEIYRFETCREFAEAFEIGEGDLILTNRFIYDPCFGELGLEADVIFQEEYGSGEPTDQMFEALWAAVDPQKAYKRVFGIGGGTVLDLAKLLALKDGSPIEELYEHKREAVREKGLCLIPTTCGTGSEVTNISILAFLSRHVKMGLAADAMYADTAILIPQLLEGLPYGVFAASSIDALIHGVESSLSPKATPYTELFGYKAVEEIIRGYQLIAQRGPEARTELLDRFLTASNFAGLAFAAAGCGAVHAMSYPLGGTFHVAHGEANYAVFLGVMKKYLEIRQDGKIRRLNRFLAQLLDCGYEQVYEKLEELLDQILSKKTMKEYGASREMLEKWADDVIQGQKRLMANSFVPLDREQVLEIYEDLYEQTEMRK